jgi:hypothetical protein
MVLDYLGYETPYDRLVTLLGTDWFGTPFRHLNRLKQLDVSVYIEHLSLEEIAEYLEQDLPVIACVHTADLSYWAYTTEHVVVIVGMDESQVYVNDPSLAQGNHPVPIVEFELAQLNFDHLCAMRYCQMLWIAG